MAIHRTELLKIKKGDEITFQVVTAKGCETVVRVVRTTTANFRLPIVAYMMEENYVVAPGDIISIKKRPR